jgi:Conserved hypothetical ATP binding protein
MRRRIGVAVLLVLVGAAALVFLSLGRPPPAPAPAPPVAAPASAVTATPTAADRAAEEAARIARRSEEREGLSSPAKPIQDIAQREAAAAPREAAERRKKQHLCPAYALPGFPWPDAPQPTTSAQIARTYLAAPGEREPATLGEVQNRLNRMAQQAGYRIPSILGAGCNGFAMVLDLERLRDDGRRVSGTDGFAGPGQRKFFSVWDILADLIKAEPGFFRIIVVVVSDEARAKSAARASADELRALSESGKAALPHALGAKAFDEGYVIDALVYEFEKFPKSEVAELRKPEGRLAATAHLAQAQLIDLARPAR